MNNKELSQNDDPCPSPYSSTGTHDKRLFTDDYCQLSVFNQPTHARSTPRRAYSTRRWHINYSKGKNHTKVYINITYLHVNEKRGSATVGIRTGRKPGTAATSKYEKRTSGTDKSDPLKSLLFTMYKSRRLSPFYDQNIAKRSRTCVIIKNPDLYIHGHADTSLNGPYSLIS